MIAAATNRTAAPTPSTWSVPSSGTSQNAVTNVPTMLPTVETEKRRPGRAAEAREVARP